MDKITEQDLANRGVKGLPDVPGLTTEEMQRKLEEIAREILIPKVNELVEGLNNANSKLNGYPSKLSQPYKTNNESHTFPIESLSLFFITYGTNDLADVYLCRCTSVNAHALVPLHTSSVIAQRYDIKLDIAARAVTIISKVPWVQVDIINL